MNNNFYDIPKDWYKEFNNAFVNSGNMIKNKDNDLTDLKEGFLRGNLFDNLYDPYKNYRYGNLKANNKREEMLYNILKYKFAMIELNLYLDVNPFDNKMVDLYNKYMMEEKVLVDEYEKNFGPLTMDSRYVGTNRWNWIESPWPWEVMR